MPSAPAPAANLPLARALFQSRRVYVFRTAPRASAARRLPWARPAVPPRLRATASVRASMQRRARIAARPWTTRACVAVHVAPATSRRLRARWACVRTSWIDRDAPNGGYSQTCCKVLLSAAGLYQPVPVLPLDRPSIWPCGRRRGRVIRLTRGEGGWRPVLRSTSARGTHRPPLFSAHNAQHSAALRRATLGNRESGCRRILGRCVACAPLSHVCRLMSGSSACGSARAALRESVCV